MVHKLRTSKRERGDESGEDDPDVERRMRAVVRSRGRLIKKVGRWRARVWLSSKSCRERRGAGEIGQ